MYADELKDWLITGVIEDSTHQLDVNLTIWGIEPIWFDDRVTDDGSCIIFRDKQTTKKTKELKEHKVEWEWEGFRTGQIWTAIRIDVEDVRNCCFLKMFSYLLFYFIYTQFLYIVYTWMGF